MNRTLDLAPVKKAGAGLFLMRVDVLDENATAIYSQEFYARVHGNVLLSVSGAVAVRAGTTVELLVELRNALHARSMRLTVDAEKRLP